MPPHLRIRPVAGALCLLLCAQAFALEGDRIRPSVGMSYTYVDNVYYLDKNVNPAALLKNGQRSDQTLGLRVGLDVDQYWHRQTFTLRSQITDNRNQTYDQLNYTSYNVKGAWNWVYGQRWDGDLGAEKTQIASNFYDFSTVDRLRRNLRTQTAVFGSAQMKMTADFKLRAALRLLEIENSRVPAVNQKQTIVEVGTRYNGKGTDEFIGTNLRVIDGTFPNRDPNATTVTDNGFRQYTIEGVGEYQLTGSSRLSGNLGLTTRRHNQFPQRNFDGITGRLTLSHALSDKTGINGTVFRDIGAWEDVVNNYLLTQGVGVTGTQSFTDKLSGQIAFQRRIRSFEGDPSIVTGARQRQDWFNTYTLSMSWFPLRQTRVDTTLSHDTRNANEAFGPGNNYRATTLYVSGQITF